MTNYFFIYTSFHAEFCRRIIDLHFKGAHNVAVNHFRRPFEAVAGDSVSEIRNLGIGFWERMRGIRAVRSQLVKAAASGDQLNIFIPHKLGILSNFAYHVLSKKYRSVRINLFYEGVIVFYSYDHNYSENLKYYATRLLSGFLIGIRYRIDKRLLDLNDKRIDKIYSPFTDLETDPDKIVYTPLKRISYNTEKGTAIILGLVLARKQQDDLRRIVNGIFEEVQSLGVTKIYYKEHPLDYSPLFHEVAKERGVELTMIRETQPVESIVHLYRPAHILSSWSSGILNLKCLLPDETSLYCFVTEEITKTTETKKLVSVFSRYGVLVKYV